jgi:hypothetical protein
VGRTDGGFATALAALITTDGSVYIANAGHLSPYLNGREIDLLRSYKEEDHRSRSGKALLVLPFPRRHAASEGTLHPIVKFGSKPLYGRTAE